MFAIGRRRLEGSLLYLWIKAVVSSIIIVAACEIAKSNAAFGARVASLLRVSVLGMIWLRRDTKDAARLAGFARSTF